MLGLITLVFGSLFILKWSDVGQKQIILEAYSDLGTKISRTCLTGGIGQTLYVSIAIPENTRAIYVANASDEPPPDKVSEDITNSRVGAGKYLCLQFFDENIPRCDVVGCDVKFTYIGTPSLKSTLQTLLSRLLGKQPVNKFYIQINKTDYKLIETIALPIVGDVLPTITPTQGPTAGPTAPAQTTTTTYSEII